MKKSTGKKDVSKSTQSPMTFEQWIKSVPAGVPKNDTDEVTIPVNLTMQGTYWFQLAQGASRNGWTLEECVRYLIVEGSPGLCEWANDEYKNSDERQADAMELAKEFPHGYSGKLRVRKGGMR